MKLICVTGRSGSGKSEFSEYLRQNLGVENVLLLNIDKISATHIKNRSYSIEEQEEHFEKQFGIEIETNEQYSELFRKGRKLANKLNDPLYRCIEYTIDSILQTTNAEYVILDWVWLPHTKYFDSCDCRILIKALDNKIRLKRILNRELKEPRRETREQYYKRLSLREKYSLDYNLYSYNFVVNNDYSSLSVFDESLQMIIANFVPVTK